VHHDAPDGGLLHHEDLVVGTPYVFPARTVTRDEIVAFAGAYDPRPPHLPQEGAAVAALSASPLHACTIMMRSLCDGLLNRVASLGAPGVDEVKWHGPVRPGDLLFTRFTLVAKRALTSRPDIGISKVVVELRNGQGELTTSWITNQLVRRRCRGPAGDAPRQAPRPPIVSLWQDALPAAAPGCDVFFEDRRIGETTDFGSHAFSEEEIVAFARSFDPQPFHLDPVRAKASLFGALCASGWHTAAIFLRRSALARMHANAAARALGMPLPAIEAPHAWLDLRWPRPVYPGDSIAFRARLAAMEDRGEGSAYGLVAHEVQGRNQKGEVTLAFTTLTRLARRRPRVP
jgi:acyl dehydratase